MMRTHPTQCPRRPQSRLLRWGHLHLPSYSGADPRSHPWLLLRPPCPATNPSASQAAIPTETPSVAIVRCLSHRGTPFWSLLARSPRSPRELFEAQVRGCPASAEALVALLAALRSKARGSADLTWLRPPVGPLWPPGVPSPSARPLHVPFSLPWSLPRPWWSRPRFRTPAAGHLLRRNPPGWVLVPHALPQRLPCSPP